MPVATVAGLALVALLALRSGRGKTALDARIATALDDLGGRMDMLADELGAAVDRLQATGLSSRALAAIGSSFDLDDLLHRTLDATTAVEGIDGAIVRANASDGVAHVASRGLPEAVAQRHPLSGPPDGQSARAITVQYLYDETDEPPGALRSGVAIPLRADGVAVGFLAAYSHDGVPALNDGSLARIEAIAAAAGPAIDAARRYHEAREAGDHDAVTGLLGRRSFHDALSREIARAHRFERRLTLVTLDVDDFRSVNGRLGQLGGDRVLAAVAGLVRGALGEADVAFRVGGDEFAVILPESARIDAEALFARVLAAVRRQQTGLSLSGGIAELRSEDDALALYGRAEDALLRAKGVGRGTAA